MERKRITSPTLNERLEDGLSEGILMNYQYMLSYQCEPVAEEPSCRLNDKYLGSINVVITPSDSVWSVGPSLTCAATW
ncbi:hypothetical protein T265_07701 [Opisthorchis viverrini]|uniref:Uncharacterized protein n=1 Tax=Opisthorchis viverrini TaxID=6198 RepID=A0A074ZBP7_OPIVI|nr:hypothetical protein T265_07701 [Opisthorchis viverrini]KER24701.1 hypothetical protein T265_07701 [Opisthorchis viverrini]